MDIEQIKQILNLVREHELSEFEIEHDGLRLKVRKEAAGVGVAMPAAHPVAPQAVATAGGSQGAQPSGSGPGAVAEASEIDIELAVVKSPIVGTFYRSPEPRAASFVEIGSS